MTLRRAPRAVAPGLALAVWLLALVAAAAAPTPYSKAAFAEAQTADRPIVVFVHATW